MNTKSYINSSLIAPCGMNCGICMAYLREKKKCPGCNGSNEDKPVYCLKCIIKNCEVIKNNQSGFCFECEKYPCLRLKQLDKRYRTKYGMSMIENLENIKNFGLKKFIIEERIRWTCSECGGIICVTGDGSLTHGIFSGKPIGFEEFLNQMVEALGVIIERRPKGRPRKRES